jgi:hypothetical protein
MVTAGLKQGQKFSFQRIREIMTDFELHANEIDLFVMNNVKIAVRILGSLRQYNLIPVYQNSSANP